MHNVDNSKSTTPKRSKYRHGSDAPKYELEIEVVGDVGAIVGLADGHGKDSICNHPRDDHVRTYSAVVVFLLLGFADAILVDLESVTEITQSFVVARVDVQLFARHFQFDGIALSRHCGAEVNMDDVVTFRAPGYIMGIAKSIHLQCANVGWQQEEVLS